MDSFCIIILSSKMKGNDNMTTKAVNRPTGRTGLTVLVITAVFTALTYVFTAFVNVRLPIAANGGLVHLGNVPLFIGAILFGKRVGAISGGVGMALFDLLSGWTLWAPFTLITVGAMGFAAGAIAYKKTKYFYYIIAVITALLIKIAGYYIAEAVIYQNLIAPLSSIPGNVVQVSLAGIVVLAVIVPLRKASEKIFR